MKKIMTLMLCAVMTAAALSGCSGQSMFSSSVDLDLTTLSSTMVYSEVYNMMTEPDKYVGKKVKMQGNFNVYEDEMTGNRYYACIIADATACCQQGMEFVPAGDFHYPEDFPEVDDEIVVVGEFEIYSEGDRTFCHLKDSQLSKL